MNTIAHLKENTPLNLDACPYYIKRKDILALGNDHLPMLCPSQKTKGWGVGGGYVCVSFINIVPTEAYCKL